MKIVILDGYTVVQDDLSWDGLKEFGDLTYYERTAPDEVSSRVDNADVLITSKCLITKDVIDKNPNLKYIGVIATGYNNVNIDYAHEKNVTVTNIPAYSTDSVAQFTFALLLETVNQVGAHNDSVQRGDWIESTDFCYAVTPQAELAGKTFGVIGYGNIGKRVAKLADALGMKVMVFSKHRSSDELSSQIPSYIRFASFNELISEADVISFHCALTDENMGIVNKESISKMKDNVIILNTSRGPLINETDLAEALKTGKISAAALDVLDKEPPRDGSPLIGLDNCIITPHIAWMTKQARQRLIDIAVSNVRSYTEGEKTNKI